MAHESPTPRIELRGVRVHNLQNVDLDIPLGMLIVVTGVSGAGKSSEESFLDIDDYREAKREFEIAFVKAKLREHGGNITKTAAAIGINRQSLQEKLRELGIQPEKE